MRLHVQMTQAAATHSTDSRSLWSLFVPFCRCPSAASLQHLQDISWFAFCNTKIRRNSLVPWNFCQSNAFQDRRSWNRLTLNLLNLTTPRWPANVAYTEKCNTCLIKKCITFLCQCLDRMCHCLSRWTRWILDPTDTGSGCNVLLARVESGRWVSDSLCSLKSVPSYLCTLQNVEPWMFWAFRICSLCVKHFDSLVKNICNAVSLVSGQSSDSTSKMLKSVELHLYCQQLLIRAQQFLTPLLGLPCFRHFETDFPGGDIHLHSRSSGDGLFHPEGERKRETPWFVVVALSKLRRRCCWSPSSWKWSTIASPVVSWTGRSAASFLALGGHFGCFWCLKIQTILKRLRWGTPAPVDLPVNEYAAMIPKNEA